MRLQDKVALVTGCARDGGIGHAMALGLAREGADIVVADYCQPSFKEHPEIKFGQMEELEALADKIRKLGRRSLPVKVDVTVEQEVAAMAQSASREFGSVDILCNNAGGWVGTVPLTEMSIEAWNRTVGMNLTGTFLCCKHVVPLMVRGGRGGRIVNTSSHAGIRAMPGVPTHYTAAKHGIVGLTRALAQELGPFRITVNAICPGMVLTTRLEGLRVEKLQQTENLGREAAIAKLAQQVPLGRLATPEDVAALVVFLASDDAQYMTGETVGITGGLP